MLSFNNLIIIIIITDYLLGKYQNFLCLLCLFFFFFLILLMEIDKSVCNSISHFKLSFLILINYPVDFLALLVCTKSNVGIPKKKKKKKRKCWFGYSCSNIIISNMIIIIIFSLLLHFFRLIFFITSQMTKEYVWMNWLLSFLLFRRKVYYLFTL